MAEEKSPQLIAGKDGEGLEATIDAQTAIPWEMQKGWYDLLAQIAQKDGGDEK
ncbi:hypothetical protein GTO89_10305 [Heliobacterium gestii]|uniref:Uncharacterized protein n=1 Tax=Heliomicrobium gestii TaxID=2699 RepID=A0A845LCZ6_HELGE|nr:hypothetical protein [Heliomicrobium gestii]MBM7867156.1 hypothetical protein [Heliomicrobium gestii]MZP43431.1 hypothetical protein [Heliomicrobium gestii]